MKSLSVLPINRTLCRALGESYEEVANQKLAELKDKFIERARRAGKPNPEGDWQRAEGTYRNMLMQDPNIRQDLEQRIANGSQGVRPAAPAAEAPAAGGGGDAKAVGSEIYGLADEIRGQVGDDGAGKVHRIMQLAMGLAQTG